LFNEYLLEDARLLLVASAFILLAILIYTQSLFLTVIVTGAVAFSLILATFLYHFVFGIEFFPFMNALGVVIAVGVGSDDAFILVRSWRSQRKSDPALSTDAQIERRVQRTLSQCGLSMAVTSVTTAVAFFASYVSSITAIKCFSVFAGLAIVSNMFLMLTWVPAGLVFYQRHCHASCCCCLRSTSKGPDGDSLEQLDTCR